VGGRAQPAHRAGPHLGTGVAGVDVTGDAATVVATAGRGAPQQLTALRRGHPVRRLVAALAGLEHLQPRPGGHQAPHVVGVAVAGAVDPQWLAVVVDRHRPVHHLVPAVPVGVGDGELVVALAGVLRAVVVRVEDPAGGEAAVAVVHRPDHAAGVVAASEDHAGPLTIQVGGAGEEPGHPVRS